MRWGPGLGWHHWFAWHPVRLQTGQTAWLEHLARRIILPEYRMVYRPWAEHVRDLITAPSKENPLGVRLTDPEVSGQGPYIPAHYAVVRTPKPPFGGK